MSGQSDVTDVTTVAVPQQIRSVGGTCVIFSSTIRKKHKGILSGLQGQEFKGEIGVIQSIALLFEVILCCL